jgi:hypothetical protein
VNVFGRALISGVIHGLPEGWRHTARAKGTIYLTRCILYDGSSEYAEFIVNSIGIIDHPQFSLFYSVD